MFGRHRIAERLFAVEAELRAIRAVLEGSFAPRSEIERLNLAFEELARRAPLSEVERLDLAFEQVGELRQELARRAPLSEVERLDLAFDELARIRTELPHEVIFHVLSERNVEIPWVVSSYGGEGRVLEVGYAFAEDRYVDALAALQIPLLIGLDLVAGPPERARAFTRVIGDVRDGVFREESFDLILCVSTIEHIGRDNRGYGIEGRTSDAPDHQAIQRLTSWLRRGGRLLLSVPFGRYEDHGWLINYDAEHLDDLMATSGLTVISERYYEQRGGWVPCNREELRHRGYGSLGVPHAGAVALIELVKT